MDVSRSVPIKEENSVNLENLIIFHPIKLSQIFALENSKILTWESMLGFLLLENKMNHITSPKSLKGFI